MDGVPTGSFVTRQNVQLADDGMPIVGRGRGIPPPQYSSTPLDGQVEKDRVPMVGRGEGMSLTDFTSALRTPRANEEKDGSEDGEPSGGQTDGTTYEDKDMELEEKQRQEELKKSDDCDQEDREADVWYKKELAEARHKKEQENKDAEIRYLREQSKIRQKRELEEREAEMRLRKDQGERAVRQHRQEQEDKDAEIQRLSGLLDGARSMVRVLSSFSEIKMEPSMRETESQRDMVYGAMPVLENMNEPEQVRKARLRANETTVPIENLTRIHEVGDGKYHGKVVEPKELGDKLIRDSDQAGENLE
jgi:hypothetical protein